VLCATVPKAQQAKPLETVNMQNLRRSLASGAAFFSSAQRICEDKLTKKIYKKEGKKPGHWSTLLTIIGHF